MQTHNLKRKNKNKKARQVGRGGTRGKTSGRGTKGQNARAGHKKRPEIRDFIKRIPKMRGRGKNINTSIQVSLYPVNLKTIESNFSNGEVVSPKTLVSKGILGTYKGKNVSIKILGTGNLTKKVTIKDCVMSKSAQDQVEKAGGTVLK
ncbi:MAG: uL15 family ribosomal protein [Candidatus Paceibacterota bacterium]